jgi:hypothetical protein
MQTMDDEPLETIHLYVMREEAARPSFLPVFLALLALSALLVLCTLSPSEQPEERLAIRIPAVFLPLSVLTVSVHIIPTGVKTYPATYAHGFLTFSNGSVIGQSIPQGFEVGGAMTDSSVYVPPATANGFGMSTVSAHLLTSGINLSTLSINEVVGSSLFIRNLSPFTGGRPAYSVTVQLPKDRLAAINTAKALVAAQQAQIRAYLAKPCKETTFVLKTLVRLSWSCLFATFQVLPYMHVLGAKLLSKDFLVYVWFIPPQKRKWVK